MLLKMAGLSHSNRKIKREGINSQLTQKDITRTISRRYLCIFRYRASLALQGGDGVKTLLSYKTGAYTCCLP